MSESTHDHDDLTATELEAPASPGEETEAPMPLEVTPTLQNAQIAQLTRELPLAETPARRAALYYAIGEWHELMEGDSAAALDAYQHAHAADPGHLPTLKAATRLLKEVGQWDLVAELLNARAQSAASAAEREDALIELAQVYAGKLANPSLAATRLEAVLAENPEHAGALALLEKTYILAAAKDPAALLDFYDRASQDERFAAERNAFVENLAQLSESTPHRRQDAIATYQHLIALDPENLLAVTALKRLLVAEKRYDELAALYRHERRHTSDPKRQALLKYLEARLALDRQNDPARGAELIREGLELDPDNALLLDELENASLQARDYEALLPIYERQLAQAESAERRLELAFKGAVLLDETLDRPEEAVAWYERALEAQPGYAPALQALGKLYMRLGRHAEQLRIWRLEAEAALDPRLKAAKYFALAEHAERTLGDHEQAIQAYRQVLALLPGYLPAIKALSELYVLTGRLSELIALNEEQLAEGGELSGEQVIYVLEKNAALWEQLGELENAAECRRRILARKADHLPSVQHLGRLYARLGQDEQLVIINQREADLINDQPRVVALLCKNGDLLEHKLHDESRAIDYYKRVLTLAPNYLPALRSLSAIYQRRAQWDDLIRMYHRELEATGEGESASHIRFKIAQVYDDKLESPDKAESNYRKILESDPGFAPALHALIRLYQRREDWAGLAALYEQQAERAADPHARRLALFKVAELAETRLHDAARAEALYRRILAEEPGHLAAARGLTRLYAAEGNLARQLDLTLAELGTTQEPARRVPLLLALADLYGEQGGHEEQVIAAFREVLQLDPTQRAVFEPLKRLYLGLGRFDEAADLYEARLALAENDDEKRAWLWLLIDLLEQHLGDFDRLAECYRELLRLDPTNRRALAFFEDAYLREQRYDELADIYERLYGQSEDKPQLLQLNVTLGELAEFKLDDPERALKRYEAALGLDPAFLPARIGARRVLARLGRYRELADLLNEELTHAGSTESYVSAAFQLGFLLDSKFNERDKALVEYLKVLELEPGHEEAFKRARRLLEEAPDYPRLVALLESRLGVCTDAHEALALHHEVARLAERKLDDPALARTHQEAIVRANPDDSDAVWHLADLYVRCGAADEAIAAYEALAPKLADTAALASLHLALGNLYADVRRDHARAISAYETVLSYVPDHVEALERLAGLYQAMHLAEEAADLYAKLLAADLPRDKAITYHLALGKLELTERHREDVAGAHFESALTLDPQNPALFDQLAELYLNQNQHARLVELYERAIDGLRPEDAGRRVAMMLALAQLYSDKLDNVGQALQVLERAVAAFPDNREVALAQARTLGRNALYYLDAIDKYRELTRREPTNVACYRELHRLFLERREVDRAFSVAVVLDFFAALPDEWADTYRRLRERTSGGIAAVIPNRELERLLVHPDERGAVRDLFRLLEPALAKVDPSDAESQDVSGYKPIGVNTTIYHLLENAAYYLGIELFRLFVEPNEAGALLMLNTKPPTIVMGGALAYASDPIKRFLSGYVMSRIRQGHLPLYAASPEHLRYQAEAACHLYFPEIVPPFSGRPSDFDDYVLRLQRAVPKVTRKELESVATDYRKLSRTPDYDAFALAMRKTDARMGLLLAGDLHAAAECLGFLQNGATYHPAVSSEEAAERCAHDPVLLDLLQFATSDEHAALRKLVRMNVD